MPKAKVKRVRKPSPAMKRLTELPDHEVAEKLFGKHLVAALKQTPHSKGEPEDQEQ